MLVLYEHEWSRGVLFHLWIILCICIFAQNIILWRILCTHDVIPEYSYRYSSKRNRIRMHARIHYTHYFRYWGSIIHLVMRPYSSSHAFSYASSCHGKQVKCGLKMCAGQYLYTPQVITGTQLARHFFSWFGHYHGWLCGVSKLCTDCNNIASCVDDSSRRAGRLRVALSYYWGEMLAMGTMRQREVDADEPGFELPVVLNSADCTLGKLRTTVHLTHTHVTWEIA